MNGFENLDNDDSDDELQTSIPSASSGDAEATTDISSDGPVVIQEDECEGFQLVKGKSTTVHYVDSFTVNNCLRNPKTRNDDEFVWQFNRKARFRAKGIEVIPTGTPKRLKYPVPTTVCLTKRDPDPLPFDRKLIDKFSLHPYTEAGLSEQSIAEYDMIIGRGILTRMLLSLSETGRKLHEHRDIHCTIEVRENKQLLFVSEEAVSETPSAGYVFEDLMTDMTSEDMKGWFHYDCMSLTLGELKLLYLVEMDCVDGDDDHYVELKTRSHTYDVPFEDYWYRMKLGGARRLYLCHYQLGKHSDVKKYTLNQSPEFDEFNNTEGKCFTKLARLLQCIKERILDRALQSANNTRFKLKYDSAGGEYSVKQLVGQSSGYSLRCEA